MAESRDERDAERRWGIRDREDDAGAANLYEQRYVTGLLGNRAAAIGRRTESRPRWPGPG